MAWAIEWLKVREEREEKEKRASNPLTLPAFVNSILSDGGHADWLGEAVKATPELAELTDADGRHAFAFAHLRCKQACERYSNLRR